MKKIADFLRNIVYIPFMFIGFVSVDIMLRSYTNEIGFYDFHHLAPLFFTCIWACILILLVTSLPRLLGKIVYLIVALVSTLYACGQYIYYQIFQNFIWFPDLAMAGEGADYVDYVLTFLSDEKVVSMLFVGLVCALISLLFFPKYKLNLAVYSIHSILFGALLICYSLIPGMIGEQKEQAEWDTWKDPRNVYDQFTNQTWMMQTAGFYEYVNRDFYTTFLKSKIVDQSEYEAIDAYFEDKPEVEKNVMTGLLKDKNVIVVMLESMDDWLIDGKYTPAISYMMENGMNFTDHYAPIFSTGATFNSEFALNTGNYSPNGGNAAYSFSKNTFTQSLPNLFKKQGYSVNSFHYNTPEFYNREIMHKNFGYENYYSFTEMTGDYKAASLDTVVADYDEIYEKLVENDKFFDFIITYSAHLPYNYNSFLCNYAVDNYPLELWNYDADYETNCAHYQANITDNFFKGLLTRLYEDGKLEDTVIVGFTDHYTYGYSDMNSVQAVSDERGAANVDQVPFFIYNYGLEEEMRMEVAKTNSTIDILPTLANLFDLDPEKYYIGYDIFDPRYTGYAYFKDYSWWDGHNYVINDEIVKGDGSVSDIQKMNEHVLKSITIGEKMVINDYFAYLNNQK